MFAATMALFAAGEVTEGPLSWISNLTGLGAALGTLWWLLTRTIPGQQQTFTKTLDAMADRWEAREAKRDAAADKVADAVTKLGENCAAKNAIRQDSGD